MAVTVTDNVSMVVGFLRMWNQSPSVAKELRTLSKSLFIVPYHMATGLLASSWRAEDQVSSLKVFF